MIEIEQLGRHPEKTFTFISHVSREASGRISARIILEGDGLNFAGLPLLDDAGEENVLAFVPMAKKGFALNLRSSDVEKGELTDLLKITTPQSLADFAPDLGFRLRHFVVKDDPSLSLYRHSLTVLTLLSNLSTVDSKILNVFIPGSSYWPYHLNKEDVWNLLSEVEDATRKMVYRREYVRPEASMRALHFFAAGNILAEKLK